MNFKNTLKTIINKFNKHDIDLALIGAFALLQCGIERATRDIDFLISAEDIEKVEKLMNELTYETVQIAKSFSQFESPIKVFGNVDFLHVSGEVGKQILMDAKKKNMFGTELKIIKPEDLIGLKVLAYANDPTREEKDKADLKLVYEAYKSGKIQLDLEKIKFYYKMFDKMGEYNKLWLHGDDKSNG